MLEKIIRLKLRFKGGQGLLNAEDLWDLPLTSTRPNQASLNSIAKEISKQLKDAGEEDFVNQKSGADEILQMQLEYVKHVIDVRKQENETLRDAADRKEKKARIMELIARKQDQELEGKSLEDLQSMVAAL